MVVWAPSRAIDTSPATTCSPLGPAFVELVSAKLASARARSQVVRSQIAVCCCMMGFLAPRSVEGRQGEVKDRIAAVDVEGLALVERKAEIERDREVLAHAQLDSEAGADQGLGALLESARIVLAHARGVQE